MNCDRYCEWGAWGRCRVTTSSDNDLIFWIVLRAILMWEFGLLQLWNRIGVAELIIAWQNYSKLF